MPNYDQDGTALFTSSGCAIFLEHRFQLAKVHYCGVWSYAIINRYCDRFLIPSFWVHNLFKERNNNAKNTLDGSVELLSEYKRKKYQSQRSCHTLVFTGIISSLNLPEAVAAAAFLCEST